MFWLPKIQSPFLAEYHLLHSWDTLRWIWSGTWPSPRPRTAHDLSQVDRKLPSWTWNLDQKDKEIGCEGLPFHLSTCEMTRHTHFPFPQACLFLRFPLNPEVPVSLLANPLLLKFINLQLNNSERATDNKLLGRKLHNEKDRAWHLALRNSRPGFESQSSCLPVECP